MHENLGALAIELTAEDLPELDAAFQISVESVTEQRWLSRATSSLRPLRGSTAACTRRDCLTD